MQISVDALMACEKIKCNYNKKFVDSFIDFVKNNDKATVVKDFDKYEHGFFLCCCGKWSDLIIKVVGDVVANVTTVYEAMDMKFNDDRDIALVRGTHGARVLDAKTGEVLVFGDEDDDEDDDEYDDADDDEE